MLQQRFLVNSKLAWDVKAELRSLTPSTTWPLAKT